MELYRIAVASTRGIRQNISHRTRLERMYRAMNETANSINETITLSEDIVTDHIYSGGHSPSAVMTTRRALIVLNAA